MAFLWKITGDFMLSCNCDVYCPCVLSLGKARPSQGVCYSWWGFRIAQGHAGPASLDGLNVALLLDVPGPMGEGNWTLGLYLDERASPPAVEALTEIFTGKVGGPPGWWSVMTATFLGTKRVPITFEPEGRGWRLVIPKIVDGVVEPLPGAGGDGLVRITNSRYFVTPDLVVCAGKKSRIHDWGRNWDLTGRSAEYGHFDWSGP